MSFWKFSWIVDFFKWLALVHSSGDAASSKRFYGGLGWMLMIGLAYLTGYKVIPTETWTAIEGYVTTVTWIAAGLLGLDTLKNGIQMFKSSRSAPNKSTDGEQTP